MDDEQQFCRRQALAQYMEVLDSEEQDHLAFYRELSVREAGEGLHRLLDRDHVSPTDPARYGVARAAQAHRRLLLKLEHRLLEDESGLVESEPS
jgi:hypothetical protein